MELKITLLPDGKVNVVGPLNNRALCYGLLGMARDAVRDYTPGAVEEASGDVVRRFLGRVNGEE